MDFYGVVFLAAAEEDKRITAPPRPYLVPAFGRELTTKFPRHTATVSCMYLWSVGANTTRLLCLFLYLLPRPLRSH